MIAVKLISKVKKFVTAVRLQILTGPGVMGGLLARFIVRGGLGNLGVIRATVAGAGVVAAVQQLLLKEGKAKR